MICLWLDAWLLGSVTILIMATSHGVPDLQWWLSTWFHHPWPTARAILHPTEATAAAASLWREIHILGGVLWAVNRWWPHDTQKKGPAEASAYGSHGTARWATPAERKEVLFSDGPGLILGKADNQVWRHRVAADGPLNDFTILFGPSKCGKSTRYAIPNMLHETECSVLVSDPKGELYRATAAAMEAKGYQVWLFNLKDFSHSMRYNPLTYCHTPEHVMQLVHILIHNTQGHQQSNADPFWADAEGAYLAALINFVLLERPPEERHLASVLRLATTLARDSEAMDALYDTLPIDHPALESYNIFRLAADSEKMRAGIITGAAVRLRLWSVREIATATCSSDFNIRDMGHQRVACYLILRDDTAAYAPLTSLIFAQAIQELYDEADRNHGGRLPVPVKLRIDEAANIGTLPEFAARVATMRSRGLSPEIILQDLPQLQRLYPHSWETIYGNCDVKLVMGVGESNTANYLSERLGQATIRVMSQGQSTSERGASASENRSHTGRPLMTPDELMRLPRNDCIVCLAGHYPIRLQKVPYTELIGGAPLQERDPRQHPLPPHGPLVVTDPKSLMPAATTDPQTLHEPLAFLPTKH